MFRDRPAVSQALLQTLADCPRRFQYRWLEQWDERIPREQQQRLDWGQRFHRRMQQWYLGLPVDQARGGEPELDACFDRFRASQPQLFVERATARAEVRRSHYHRGWLLTGVFDLLRQTPTGLEIHDWKTGLFPRPRRQLQHQWQTRLYLYLLAETGDLPPEQLSLTYWFVRADPVCSERFDYSAAWHGRIRRELDGLLTQLEQGLEGAQLWAAAPHTDTLCDRCPYREPCRGGEGEATAGPVSWADVPEISF